MDVKSANPFLFNEDDYTSPHSAVSNPFLMGGDDYQESTAVGDNPFLSQTAATMVSNTTNPFAFDPMDLGPSEAQSADVFTSNATTAPTFVNTSEQNIFANNYVMPQKPTDLDLKYTNTVDIAQEVLSDAEQDGGRNFPPRPAPPPRPPPSKETQDLLMSVMGAMDATSSHLLDKIPPTRTPSPVSMRDLHSPSPTPEPTFGDLLDVSDAKSSVDNFTQQQKLNNTDDLLFGLSQDNNCDINQNPPMTINTSAAQIAPTRPAPPVRPPRPQPPQKPPPPNIVQQPTAIHPPQNVTQPLSNIAQPPPKPPPPAAKPPQTQAQPEMMDMFGIEDFPQPKTKASKADILNLYNKPEPPKRTDLLFDDAIETEPTVVQNGAENVSVAPKPMLTEVADPNRLAEIKPSNVENAPNTPIVTHDNFLSPEPSQNDLQMDTSDSQSKGSVSSVTFNPFAATDGHNSQNSSRKPSDAFQQEPVNDSVFLDDTSSDFQKQDAVADVFGAPEVPQPQQQAFNDAFAVGSSNDAFAFGAKTEQANFGGAGKTVDAFDAFAEKFESARKDDKAVNDAFADDTWGNDGKAFNDTSAGFGAEESFDAFLALQEPPAVPQSTPNRLNRSGSQDSDEDKDFSVIIRPKAADEGFDGTMPILAPPPAPVQNAFNDSSPRFNPFDQTEQANAAVLNQEVARPFGEPELKRSDSQETPPTPLFDEDVSQPLEPFPRINYTGDGWEMHLRQPNKKKITGQRFWKKIFVRIVHQQDCVLLQLFNQQSDKDPFQELPLQPCYSVSDIGAQQYDQFGKIFTVKLQYIFYKERPGVRPGQVKKAERITNKLSQFAAYAIQGDYQGVKEFGSDLKKLGLPVEHAPQVSQLMKIGSLNYEDLKQFSVSIEEALFKLQAHRDRALHYKMEEVQITAVDELYVEQDSEGHVEKQIARVRLFFLGFLTGMPDVELGVNDMRRQGKEVVGRHDIIPVVTEEWIRLEAVEFHSCIQQDEYENTHIIKFKPPDACYIELMRFRIRPPKNRELPLQLKATICITGNRVELRADVLVPGFASRKLGQIPCEDVMIRFPIPECWIYLFRVEKHFRYGSVKSAHRRTGKIKGIERILGTVDTLQESLIEVTSGQAKYEHQHRAIVWRCPRLPKEGQGAYTTHNMVCRLALTSYDQMPDQFGEYCYVEFTMPATQASHTTVRSVSLQNSDSDEPPEKYVRYLARHEYRVGIERTQGEGPNAYVAATTYSKPAVKQEEAPPQTIAEAESSSDSD